MNKLMIVLFVLFLYGCDGGGSGNNLNQENEQEKQETETKIVSINEKESTELDLGRSGLSVSETTLISGITEGSDDTITSSFIEAYFDGSILKINVAGVESPTRIDLIINDENGEKVYTVEIYINNNSADDIIEQANVALNEKDDLLNLKSDRKIYFYIIDRAYLKNIVTNKDKNDFMDNFDPASSSSYSSLSSSFFNLESKMSQYNNGEISAQEVEISLSELSQYLENHSKYGVQKIEDIEFLSESELPDFNFGKMSYSEEEKTYSRFIGTSEYGEFIENKWVFGEGYQILEKLADKNEIGVCSIY